MCHGCRMPITESDKLSPNNFKKALVVQIALITKTPEQKRRYAERTKQIDLAKAKK